VVNTVVSLDLFYGQRVYLRLSTIGVLALLTGGSRAAASPMDWQDVQGLTVEHQPFAPPVAISKPGLLSTV